MKGFSLIIHYILLGLWCWPSIMYAQEDNSLQKSWNDIKNSFKSKRLLLYPNTDSTSSDFLAFRNALHQHPKVDGSELVVKENGIVMTVKTKQDLNLLWISMPKDVRNRYRLGKRDANDIIPLTDMQKVDEGGSVRNKTNKPTNTENTSRTPDRKPAITEKQTYGQTNWSALPLAHKKDGFIPLTNPERECKFSAPETPIRIAVAPFFVSASYDAGGSSNSTADSIISRLERVACFATYPEYIDFVPGGCQVIVTGDVKDYFTSEKKMGKPRLKWVVELRKAADFSILNQKEFSIEGDVYKGTGENLPLAKSWDNILQQTVAWIHAQSGQLAKVSFATETEAVVLDSSMFLRKRVQTESVMAGQQRYGEAKMARNKKRNLGLSEYYNDTAYRNSLPKIPYDEFIEYSISGKKYQFFENAPKIEQQASLSLIEGRSLTGGVDIKVTIRPSMMAGEMTIGMFDPSHYPTVRRFHFGSNPKKDSRVEDGYEQVYCFASLPGGFKEDKFSMKLIPTEKVTVVASNLKGQENSNNVAEGFIQILDFETGMYGVLEAMFEFSTKAMTDKNGKAIPPKIIKGRFRVRGNISPPIDY